ncbi:hypothetical protein [Rubripirellula obstinata]|nr:hypothetical protein [Rubripirellula obstinata]
MTFSREFFRTNGSAAIASERFDAEKTAAAKPSASKLPSEAAKVIDEKEVNAKKRKIAVVFAVACFAVAAFIASTAMGQERGQKYDSIEINPRIDTAGAVRTMKAETRSFASIGKGNGGAVKAYFEQYVPGKMTAPDGVEHLSEIVDDVTGYLERANKGGRPEIARGLSGLTFRSLGRVATGNYHPTARIAATVIIGGLDSKPVDIGNKKPPVPLDTVLPVLISLYENEKNVDGLRAAALQGIHRHAMYSFNTMPADLKTKLTGLMNDLLDADAPADRDIEAHAFLQRYAVDILDYTSDGQDPALGLKLVSISTEPKSLEMIALHSASRLASMSGVLENKIEKPKDVLWSWTVRTLTAFENEIERIEGMKRRQTNVRQPQDPSTHLRKPEENKPGRRAGAGGMRGGGSMMGDDMMMDDMMMDDMMDDGGGYRGMMGSDMMDDDMMMGEMGGNFSRDLPKVIQDPEIVATRRKLNHVLQQVHLGVTGSPTAGMPEGKPGGLLGSVDDATKKEIETWAEAMEDIIDEINDSQIELTQEFLLVLKEQIEPLEELVDSIDDHLVEVDAPKRDGGVADELQSELMGDDALEEALEEDLMAEPAMLP